MYNGIIQLYSPYNPLIFLVVVIPALAACTLGYYLGIKDRRLLGFVSSRGKNTDDKNYR